MKYKLLLILWLATTVTAYTNDSMTTPYRELFNNQPIHAVAHQLDSVWDDWFYIMLVVGPFVAMWMYQRDLTIPSIWLWSVTVAYNYLIDSIDRTILLLVFGGWMTLTILRTFSSIYRN